MRAYNCWVNVGGDASDEGQPTTVKKEGVSAAEILVLRSMFGVERVTDVRKGLMDKRSHIDERKILDERYGKHRTDPILGPSVGAKLPVTLEEDDALPGVDEKVAPPAPAAEEDEDEVLAPRSGRKAA